MPGNIVYPILTGFFKKLKFQLTSTAKNADQIKALYQTEAFQALVLQQSTAATKAQQLWDSLEKDVSNKLITADYIYLLLSYIDLSQPANAKKLLNFLRKNPAFAAHFIQQMTDVKFKKPATIEVSLVDNLISGRQLSDAVTRAKQDLKDKLYSDSYSALATGLAGQYRSLWKKTEPGNLLKLVPTITRVEDDPTRLTVNTPTLEGKISFLAQIYDNNTILKRHLLHHIKLCAARGEQLPDNIAYLVASRPTLWKQIDYKTGFWGSLFSRIRNSQARQHRAMLARVSKLFENKLRGININPPQEVGSSQHPNTEGQGLVNDQREEVSASSIDKIEMPISSLKDDGQIEAREIQLEPIDEEIEEEAITTLVFPNVSDVLDLPQSAENYIKPKSIPTSTAVAPVMDEFAKSNDPELIEKVETSSSTTPLTSHTIEEVEFTDEELIRNNEGQIRDLRSQSDAAMNDDNSSAQTLNDTAVSDHSDYEEPLSEQSVLANLQEQIQIEVSPTASDALDLAESAEDDIRPESVTISNPVAPVVDKLATNDQETIEEVEISSFTPTASHNEKEEVEFTDELNDEGQYLDPQRQSDAVMNDDNSSAQTLNDTAVSDYSNYEEPLLEQAVLANLQEQIQTEVSPTASDVLDLAESAEDDIRPESVTTSNPVAPVVDELATNDQEAIGEVEISSFTPTASHSEKGEVEFTDELNDQSQYLELQRQSDAAMNDDNSSAQALNHDAVSDHLVNEELLLEQPILTNLQEQIPAEVLPTASEVLDLAQSFDTDIRAYLVDISSPVAPVLDELAKTNDPEEIIELETSSPVIFANQSKEEEADSSDEELVEELVRSNEAHDSDQQSQSNTLESAHDSLPEITFSTRDATNMHTLYKAVAVEAACERLRNAVSELAANMEKSKMEETRRLEGRLIGRTYSPEPPATPSPVAYDPGLPSNTPSPVAYDPGLPSNTPSPLYSPGLPDSSPSPASYSPGLPSSSTPSPMNITSPVRSQQKSDRSLFETPRAKRTRRGGRGAPPKIVLQFPDSPLKSQRRQVSADDTKHSSDQEVNLASNPTIVMNNPL